MGNLKLESEQLFMPNAGSIDDRGNGSGLFKANHLCKGARYTSATSLMPNSSGNVRHIAPRYARGAIT